ITAVRQWTRELLDKTFVREEDIGEYTGEVKQIRPITLTTYQMVSHRPEKHAQFKHFDIFDKENWGLIIYDEVHLLPAPIFRITAEIQSKRRLGLTATLVREDGREDDVFSLIGPKRYDVPWKELEKQGWIAKAVCTEVRISFPDESRIDYAISGRRARYRVAAENPLKMEVVDQLVKVHSGENVLIIGQYISQLERLQSRLGAPLIVGKTPSRERDRLYDLFRKGDIKLLVVSKVGNFAIDLPDANVLIQISGTFGSRQEEAQRLGRILRPKSDGSTAHFYSLITRNSDEMEFAARRQLFLTEQGYKYRIVGEKELYESA
ncbi:MAG: DEAD/DEAH box helicase, partial [Candidatus Brocadiia bacterium]